MMDAYYSSNNHTVTILPGILPQKLQQSVLICTAVSSCLSILGSLLIFMTYCIVEDAKNHTRRLLVYLTISDFLICVGNLLGTIRYALKYQEIDLEDLERNCRHSDNICVIQSCLTTFASLASFGWTFVIGLHLMTSLRYQKTMGMKWRITCHIGCWGGPILITTIAAFMNVLGEDFSITSGPWCWIRGCLHSSLDTVVWMTVTGKGWEIVTYLATTILYIHLKYFMYKQRKTADRRIGFYEQSGSSLLRMQLRNEDEIYTMQWLLLYVLRLWGTVRYGIATDKLLSKGSMSIFDTADNVLLHMQSIGDSGHALCNCILFCFCDETVRRTLLYRILHWGRRTAETNELIDPSIN